MRCDSRWHTKAEPPRMIIKIISGGQAGVARAALDWAMRQFRKRPRCYGGQELDCRAEKIVSVYDVHRRKM